MEHTGYILFITDTKDYYHEIIGRIDNPFDAKMYFSKEYANEIKQSIEESLRCEVKIIKVKKTINVIQE